MTNEAEHDMRVWVVGNSWGDHAFWFEVEAAGQSAAVKMKTQSYTRNVPASSRLAPGASYEVPFDLDEKVWDWQRARPLLSHPKAALRVVYDSGDGDDRREQDVWQGQMRSDLVPLHG